MATFLAVAGVGLFLLLAGAWVVKRKLARLGQHLPTALEQ